MIDEEGRNCTVVADGRSGAAVPLCSERASDAHLTVLRLYTYPSRSRLLHANAPCSVSGLLTDYYTAAPSHYLSYL